MNSKVQTKFLGYGVLFESLKYKKWYDSKGEAFHSYRAEWARRAIERDAGYGPLNINVEVTTRCNLACTFCTNTSLRDDQIGDLDIEIFKSVVSDLASKNRAAPSVNLNGLGEPLLRKDLLEFISIAKDYGAIDIMFHTNGTTLTEDIANSLVNSGVDRIIVSVDSPDQHTYEAMRLLKISVDTNRNNPKNKVKGFSHKKLIANTKRILSLASTKSDGPIVRTTCVLTDETSRQLDDYLTLWKSAGADQITFQDLSWRSKIDSKGEELWENGETSILQDNYDEIKKNAIESGIVFSCPYLYQATWINFNGDIVPCSNPNAREHMIMGNVTKETMSGIWNGPKYTDLRELHNKGEWHKHPICTNCEKPLVEIYKHISQKSTVEDVDVIDDR